MPEQVRNARQWDALSQQQRYRAVAWAVPERRRQRRVGLAEKPLEALRDYRGLQWAPSRVGAHEVAHRGVLDRKARQRAGAALPPRTPRSGTMRRPSYESGPRPRQNSARASRRERCVASLGPTRGAHGRCLRVGAPIAVHPHSTAPAPTRSARVCSTGVLRPGRRSLPSEGVHTRIGGLSSALGGPGMQSTARAIGLPAGLAGVALLAGAKALALVSGPGDAARGAPRRHHGLRRCE